MGNNVLRVFVITLIMAASMFPAGLNAFPNYLLDEVDVCILTCDRCYKGQSLVNCANDCIDTEGDVGRSWRVTCPFFDDTPQVQQL